MTKNFTLREDGKDDPQTVIVSFTPPENVVGSERFPMSITKPPHVAKSITFREDGGGGSTGDEEQKLLNGHEERNVVATAVGGGSLPPPTKVRNGGILK